MVEFSLDHVEADVVAGNVGVLPYDPAAPPTVGALKFRELEIELGAETLEQQLRRLPIFNALKNKLCEGLSPDDLIPLENDKYNRLINMVSDVHADVRDADVTAHESEQWWLRWKDIVRESTAASVFLMLVTVAAGQQYFTSTDLFLLCTGLGLDISVGKLELTPLLRLPGDAGYYPGNYVSLLRR